MKIGYQLKQVRERLAKGLVDKGILRTEKRNFLLFDMATHPIADMAVKDEIIKRVCTTLVSRTTPASFDSQSGLRNAYLRTVAMICSAYAANVLENSLFSLSYDMREKAFAKVDEYLADFSTWPFTGTGSKVNVHTGTELSMEVVAAVLNVFTKMDSIVSVIRFVALLTNDTCSFVLLITNFFHSIDSFEAVQQCNQGVLSAKSC